MPETLHQKGRARMGWLDDRKKDMKKAQDLKKQKKKFTDLYNTAEKLLDEDERDGAIFKEAIKHTLNIAGRLIGKSLSKHPYVSYHKTHMEALGTVLNASAMTNMARQAAAAAGKTAAQVTLIAKHADEYAARRNKLMHEYDNLYLEILKDMKEYAETGRVLDRMVNGVMPPDELDMLRQQADYVAKTFPRWIEEWDDLVDDAFALLVMVRVESNRVEKLMNRYDEKKNKLLKGGTGLKGNINYIGGKSLERDEGYRQLAVETARQVRSPETEALEAAARPRAAVARALEKVEQEARLCASGAAIATAASAIDYPGQATAQFAYLRNGR
jgi:hypothetical protein